VLKDVTDAKYDEIFDVHFKDFFNADGILFAWMWIGLSQFKKAIPPKNNPMRGLRLRKENIQIGGEDSLQKLFKENRGNSYFVGEVFAVDKELIPNSQRDYFNENRARTDFEHELKKYFNEELQKVYYAGSDINSAYKKIDSFEKKETDFKVKEANNTFVDDAHRKYELKSVQDSKGESEAAQIKIEKTKGKADSLAQRVISHIEAERAKSVAKSVSSKSQALENAKLSRQRDKLSKYSKKERNLISKILRIISATVDAETADKITKKIEEEL